MLFSSTRRFERQQASHKLSFISLAICCALTACGGGSDQEDLSNAPEARSAQALAVTAPIGDWFKLTDEGVSFEMPFERNVRFGAGSQWVRKRIVGVAKCETATFGTDPAPGVAKTCEVRETAKGHGLAALDWQDSEESAVVAYRVYYGTAPEVYDQPLGSGLMASNVSKFSVAGLLPGASYYFAVTAIDASGNESAYSNEVNKQVQ